jgi:uncharacterized protein YjbI with pentapeptide repeats
MSMSEQESVQSALLKHLTTNNQDEWKTKWKIYGQPWRTEPEIDKERQKYLAEWRGIIPNFEKDIYPFKGIKLSRADVEWLLATHQNGRGPVDWSNESQREREGLDLRGADLCKLDLRGLPLARMKGGLDWFSCMKNTVEQREPVTIRLDGADLREAHLEGADLGSAHLKRANLREAHLEEAFLGHAHLEGAKLSLAHLEEADIQDAHLEGADLRSAQLGGTNLKGVFFDSSTNLSAVFLSSKQFGEVSLADIHWSDVNIAVIDWSTIPIVGDERKAQQNKDPLYYSIAVRAYRQLSVVLRSQGLNEQASHFAYRAQMLQRTTFRLQGSARSFLHYLSSLALDLLAGYGYRPWRSFLAYLLVITAFAIAYFIISSTVGRSLSPIGAMVFSMTSFHGRGFFPGGIQLDNPLTILAALEAFVGLLIEVTFIATLTQRLFGK